MRIHGQHDAFLIGGFTIALAVVFETPIRFVLNVAREIEDTYGLALIPGLIILAVVFVFHQQAKRQEVTAEATAAAVEAKQATHRARELEQLVALGQTVAKALDVETLRRTLSRYLPALADDHELWVLTRSALGWQPLIQPEVGFRSDQLDAVADRAMALTVHETKATIEVDGHLCFPMHVGDTAVGVLGVVLGRKDFTEGRRRVLTAAAAIVAIAVKNVQLFGQVRDNSLRDGLTGCFNRGHALETIDTELRRSRRSQSPLSIVLFDVDKFKSINDTHGHLCGDAVLTAVAQRLREVLRVTDVKCRYGGDEFLIVLPDTPLEGAQQAAESVRRAISQLVIEYSEKRIQVSSTFGVAGADAEESDAQALIARADAALYRAKAAGRNCVRVAADTDIARVATFDRQGAARSPELADRTQAEPEPQPAG